MGQNTKKSIKPNISNKSLAIVLALTGLFLVILIYSIAIAISRIGKVAVEVRIAPYDSTVLLDGKRILSKGKVYIAPGDYTLNVSYEHFETKETTVTISKESPYIGLTLIAADEQGEEYITNHENQFVAAEGIIGILANIQGDQLQKQYPILKYLPINNSLYSISYSMENNESAPKILVKSSLDYLDIAVAKIKTFKDLNPIDYEINFNIPDLFTIRDSSKASLDLYAKEAISADNFNLLSTQELNSEYGLAIFSHYDPAIKIHQGKYLVLLKKTSDSWEVIHRPQPLFTKYNMADVPEDVLNLANTYAGQ